MPAYETSALVHAPVKGAWPVLSRVVAWPQWLPTVDSVHPLDGACLALGARFVLHQPKLRATTWKVTQLEPPHLFVWSARHPGIAMLAEHRLDADESAPDVCTLVLRFVFAGWLGGIAGRLSRSVTEDYLAQEAAAFKAIMEALERYRD